MPKHSSTLFPAINPIDKDSAVPLHKQLYERFRDAVLNGQLRAGARLPSTRELAAHLGISRNTVMTAFEQLFAEGFLTGKVGAGTFVTEQLVQHSPLAINLAEPPFVPVGAASCISELLSRQQREYFLDSLGPFRASVPALDLFPWATWHSLLSQCARRQTRAQLAYSGALGLQPCREAIANYLRMARNVRCHAEQIIIVSGSQQALCLAAQVLLEHGDLVWLEEPGYAGARDAFLLSGLVLGPVPVGDAGLNIDLGRQLFPNARMAYVTPSHQYPLGVTMPLQRRMELLEWAATNDAWIIEDDYDSEYRYASRPVSSLQGLAEQNRVIYIGTFSKVLFPSLRVGYMVVPEPLVDRFLAVRKASDIFAPPLFQMVLTEFINQGHFARHIRRMRGVYSERRDELTACLEQELGDRAQVGAAESGTHLVLYPKQELDDISLCKAAARHGIVAMPLSACYFTAPKRSGIVLGFGGTDLAQIRRAVWLLRNAFDEVAVTKTDFRA
ncbi:MAG: PLP-dependent aminotransferase family protein [Acidobacteriaceae bacterium]|nr:PLP-dependent aminotransferase family protein [Acidobacteriaceae bacterium]